MDPDTSKPIIRRLFFGQWETSKCEVDIKYCSMRLTVHILNRDDTKTFTGETVYLEFPLKLPKR